MFIYSCSIQGYFLKSVYWYSGPNHLVGIYFMLVHNPGIIHWPARMTSNVWSVKSAKHDSRIQTISAESKLNKHPICFINSRGSDGETMSNNVKHMVLILATNHQGFNSKKGQSPSVFPANAACHSPGLSPKG